MKTLSDLINTTDPAWPLIQEWLAEATNPVEILPPDTLKWEDCELGYTDFLNWAFSGDLALFYENMR